MDRNLLLTLGVAVIILGLFGLLLASGLPDVAIAAIGFAVAAVALWLGLRMRPDA